MSAEILRRAADLMRERANYAASAWGGTTWSAGETGYDDRQGMTYDVHTGMALVAAAGCEELADHIASWHPSVALAVADWLDATAYNFDVTPDLPSRNAALTAARTYLGTASPAPTKETP